ncbi:MAG: ABC transporter substrate-binding protein [Oscillospiraceae bacterium]|nr:ABC transporter substrate-binding protein [Oscillospiraceae bacterium]
MKKTIALVMTFALVMMLAACGGSSTSAAPAASNAPAASAAAPADDSITIGLIQLVEHPSLDEIRAAFEAQLKAQGYDNVVIDYQNGQNDSSTMNSICQKFVGDDVDMIVAIATPAAQSAAAATSDIPVVFAAVTDPVGAGLVGADGAPDRNCTGTSDAIATADIFDLADKMTPGIKTYGFIYNLAETNSVTVINEAKSVLDGRGVAYTEACVTNSGEVTTAAQSLFGKVDAIFCPIDNTVAYAMPNLAQLANEVKMPVYVAADSMVNDGGLATVGVNYTQLGKQTADMAIEILEGKDVKDVPVQVLSEYSTVINEETAKALGIDENLYK